MKKCMMLFVAILSLGAWAIPSVDPAALKEFQSYFKVMGDPKFYMVSTSDAMDSQFVEFFTGLGMTVVRARDGADYELAVVGKFMDAENEDGDMGVKLSMSVSIKEFDASTVLFSVKNDPKAASTFKSVGEERRREIVVEKAFKQIEPKLLTEFKALAERKGLGGSPAGVASTVKPSEIEIVIMEEPFALGQMKVAKAFGTELEGSRFFYQNYTTIQRKVRDLLVELATKMEFDVKLLEGNDAYENFKTKDATLVGFYYNVQTEQFERDKELMAEVKANNPDALVLYYRIDSLVYETETANIHVSVALNIKNPGSNVTRPVGMKTFEAKGKSNIKDVLMDEMANTVAEAVRRLWITDGAGGKLLKLAGEIGGEASKTKTAGPIKLNINALVFDEKVRKTALYTIGKKLEEKKLCARKDIKRTNSSIRATITSAEIEDPEMLYMEYVRPILEEMGVEVTDDQVNYAGNELTIKPGK